jgi:hypothetical protein
MNGPALYKALYIGCMYKKRILFSTRTAYSKSSEQAKSAGTLEANMKNV